MPRAKSSILIGTDILPGGVTAGSKNGMHRHRSSAAPYIRQVTNDERYTALNPRMTMQKIINSPA